MPVLKEQLALFRLDPIETVDTQEWGTFKDSLRAPIHNWFTYPAGFSYKAVAASFKTHQISTGDTVYDPFMGSGTTNLTAKKQGINSYGVEAHPFVFRIAKAKLNWNVHRSEVLSWLAAIKNYYQQHQLSNGNLSSLLEREFPELVRKCYDPIGLYNLFLLREAIKHQEDTPVLTDFFFVALTGLLREVSLASTGWPYIAPKKQKTTSINKDVWQEFHKLVLRMLQDVEITVKEAKPAYERTQHLIFNADARDTHGFVPDQRVDHVFTSPPYLNNFDYADRTRLELYFWGEAETWGDISQNIRTRLITSATTQIQRNDPRYELSNDLRQVAPLIADFLDESVTELSQRRLTKGGKKSYDHLVSGYFNDIFQVLKDVYRVLKPGRRAIFVLGDSAPYGVHIPTDELIGRLGVAVGFSGYALEILRTRGGKWKDNPQRHTVELRESIVTLKK